MDPVIIAVIAFVVIILLLRIFMKLAGCFLKAGILIVIVVLIWRLFLNGQAQ